MLPPLEWIRVFEAAARLGNFTAAAAELGLTQAAVSQRIRNLELRLRVQLFERQPRGVTLTTAGEAWLPHVQSALRHLASSAADLFAAPSRKIAIAASTSVIELWIVPRLPLIAARLPHLQLAFDTIVRQPDYGDADFDIRFGEGRWPDREAVKLYPERLTPLAAPALLTRSAHWQSLPRIATSGPRAGWSDWDRISDAPPAALPILRFDSFAQSLGAAEHGAGVVLGSLALCDAALSAGRLVRLTDAVLSMEAAYWITWNRNRPNLPELPKLLECLTGPAA